MSDRMIGVTIIATIILAIAGLFFGVFGISWHAAHVDCLRLHEQTGFPTRMVGTMWGGGCYIYIDGRWVPDSRYRMFEQSDN